MEEVEEEAMGAGGLGIVRVRARVLVRTTLMRQAKWKAREPCAVCALAPSSEPGLLCPALRRILQLGAVDMHV